MNALLELGKRLYTAAEVYVWVMLLGAAAALVILLGSLICGVFAWREHRRNAHRKRNITPLR